MASIVDIVSPLALAPPPWLVSDFYLSQKHTFLSLNKHSLLVAGLERCTKHALVDELCNRLLRFRTRIFEKPVHEQTYSSTLACANEEFDESILKHLRDNFPWPDGECALTESYSIALPTILSHVASCFGQLPAVQIERLQTSLHIRSRSSSRGTIFFTAVKPKTNYRLPSYATTRLITAKLLQDFHSFLSDVYRDHGGVKLHRTRLIKRSKDEIAIAIRLKIKPRTHPVNVFLYNDILENLSRRGLDIHFTWPIKRQ
ncbi:hypothetical protein EV360DRAFT_88042 [Lentinula raphanica]|nr:hypothetical protein EV360DRAFT_88042 [Lentinula raphanica]